MAPRKRDARVASRAAVEDKKNVPKQEMSFDIDKILAEREQRRQELRNLPELESPASFAILSDSQMFESSQDSSQTPQKLKASCLTELEIFDRRQVFRLFTEDKVNIGWIQGSEDTVNDISKLSAHDLIQYLNDKMAALKLKRSSEFGTVMCRYLFFLMSTTTNESLRTACQSLLLEMILLEKKPFSINPSDLIVVLMNYGALKSKLWCGSDLKIDYPSGIREKRANTFDPKIDNSDLPFPNENLKCVLEVLQCNLQNQSNPPFTESEMIGFFRLMLNLSKADGMMNQSSFYAKPLIPLIKNVMSCILDSFTEEEWRERSYARAEDFAEACWHDEMDHAGIVHRIQSVPTTSLRGIQVQQSAAHYAVQMLMGAEPSCEQVFDTVHLIGKVSLDDVVSLIGKVMKAKLENYGLSHSCAILISVCIDLDDTSQNQEKLREVARLTSDWKHSIRDLLMGDLDENRLAIKNFLTEQHTMWINSCFSSDQIE